MTRDESDKSTRAPHHTDAALEGLLDIFKLSDPTDTKENLTGRTTPT